MRVYDPRAGRFLSVDPISVEYPELTPYQFASNRPIDGIDQDGLEWTRPTNNEGLINARESVANVSGNPVTPKTLPPPYPPLYRIPIRHDYFSQYRKPLNDYEKLRQEEVRRRNYVELGYRPDGSKGFLMKLKDNKCWNNFADNLVFPLLEGYGYATGAGQVRTLLKKGFQVAVKSLPTRLARVIPEQYAGTETLGKAGALDVFVTDASQLKGLTTSEQIAQKLTLVDEQGNLIKGPFRIIEFDTPLSGLAQPLNRVNPGFIPGGQTAGGATEYVIPNLRIGELKNVTQTTIN